MHVDYGKRDKENSHVFVTQRHSKLPCNQGFLARLEGFQENDAPAESNRTYLWSRLCVMRALEATIATGLFSATVSANANASLTTCSRPPSTTLDINPS